jgi:polysaccharide deacetylase family protein (PEP-CTERM system associated)
MTIEPQPAARHLLTIGLEDYYQVGAFNRLIQRGEWYRFESRLERNTRRVLALLDEHDQRATFFVLGWVADAVPELIAEVAVRGHEIASRGYYHRSIRAMTPGEFREDLARARDALQRASGQRILGYRVADAWFGPDDLWALDVLAEQGYEYDSSIGPIGRRFAAEPWRRFAHTHQFGERTLWEFPISAVEFLGWMIPIAGGNWMRQIPPFLVKPRVEHWHRTYRAPYVMYFHAWELDPEQPKISAAPWLQRLRTYRNLGQMPERLGHYLSRYRFTSIAEHVGLATHLTGRTTPIPREPARREAAVIRPRTVQSQGTDKTPVTVVIPCFNEELILPYLDNTLRSVRSALASRYDLRFLFVDDGSSDGTADALERIFGGQQGCRVMRHARNLGVAGAIATGLREAETEIVASIDCDCTYDPHTLAEMIPMLGEESDLVTASPYHPRGTVRNVPEWRLTLSRTLSRLYRLVLHHKLATYTSCFRVYRRSTVLQVPIEDYRFLGVAELLGRLDLMGGRIVEFPTTLQVRMLGRSKMKILRTILGHLGLLARLARQRISGGGTQLIPAPRLSTPPAVVTGV